MEMARADAAGAEAAARYFLSLYPYIMQSGDVAEWDAMTFETCDFCTEIKKAAKRYAENKDTFVGGEIEVTSLRVLPIDEEIRGYPIDVSIQQKRSMRSNSSGKVVENGQSQAGSIRIDTLCLKGKWVILAVAKAS